MLVNFTSEKKIVLWEGSFGPNDLVFALALDTLTLHGSNCWGIKISVCSFHWHFKL